MEKKDDFDETIDELLPWPQAGDDPLVIPPPGSADGTINENDYSRCMMMILGYKKSADHLVNVALTNELEGDFLVYPILFLYRHYLELQIKVLIDEYGPQVEIDPNWNSHKLDELWGTLKTILKESGSSDPDEPTQIVEGIVAQIAKVDPQSFSHRYPRDRDGKPIEAIQGRFDFGHLKVVMNRAFEYFSACHNHLDVLQSDGS